MKSVTGFSALAMVLPFEMSPIRFDVLAIQSPPDAFGCGCEEIQPDHGDVAAVLIPER